MCTFSPYIPVIVNDPYKLSYIMYFIWIKMYLMEYNLYPRGISILFLTHKPMYLVSIHPKNEFSIFILNPASASLCKNFSRYLTWSKKSFLVITSMSYMYTPTISNPSNSLDIFYWNISRLLQKPMGSFWYS